MKMIVPIILGCLGVFTGIMSMKPPTLSSFKYDAAFVAPITRNGINEYIILGREAGGTDRHTYDAFGGKRDRGEAHPIVTAAREFAEEGVTKGSLGMDIPQVLDFIDLKEGNTTNVFAVQSAQGTYRHVLYLTKFPRKDIGTFKATFGRARANAPARGKYHEKDSIASVKMSDLEAAITASRSNRGVKVMAQVTELDGTKSMKLITLRPVFVRIMRGYAEKRSYVPGTTNHIRFYTI